MNKKKKFLFFFTTLFFLTSKISLSLNIQNSPSKAIYQKENHVITIWIHGTRCENNLLHNYLIKNMFYRFYKKTGLHRASAYKRKSHFIRVAKNLSSQKTKRFNWKNFYIFGWSGKLDPKHREMAANNLYSSILELSKYYKSKYKITPKIRLVTHSHGGNVALYLSKINDQYSNKMTISELVLLACPVQSNTAQLIKSKTFKKIYSLYSTLDIIQVIDPQWIHAIKQSIRNICKSPFFSRRAFEPQKNLSQAHITINNRGILHIEFISKKFLQLLPGILEKLDILKIKESNNPEAYKKIKHLTFSSPAGFQICDLAVTASYFVLGFALNFYHNLITSGQAEILFNPTKKATHDLTITKNLIF